VSLARDWARVQEALPAGWSRAELRLTTADGRTATRAAAMLAPAQPFRPEQHVLRFASARDGSATGPDAVTRLLRRLDEAGVRGHLELADTSAPVALEERPEPGLSLVASWQLAVKGLPPDWSDLYAEVRLESSDYIDPGAVLLAPLNPRRDGTRLALRFRAARRAGYGASPGMVERCFERCDGMGMQGSVEVLRVLSDTRLVATQGPTWLLSGKNV
jgi:hypothetical protein